jgi:ATP-dependent DNA helicase RecG
VISVESPIATVLGTGKKQVDKQVDKLGLRTVGDLLAHHPRRYLERGQLSDVTSLEPGQLLTVVGVIASSSVNTYVDRRTRRQAYRVDAVVRTKGPSLRLSFFAKHRHTAEWQQRRLRVGEEGVFDGKVSTFRNEWQLTNPRIVMFHGDNDESTTARELTENLKPLFPLYPATKGLDSWEIQRAVHFALTVVDTPPELVPSEIREAYDLVNTEQALAWIHEPDTWPQIKAAQRRFRFEEALVTQLVLARRRIAYRSLGGKPMSGGGGLLAEFDQRLPFELTAGQREVGAEIEADLARRHPMNRLLQGEVGSGKTLVALRAMLRVIDSGGQTALLAPTEVLAQQHCRSIRGMLGDLADAGMLGGAADGTTVALLTGSMGRKQREEAMSHIASGEAGIVIGTHALLEDKVWFADLGLVVVDEQHRFGVEQRAALAGKSAVPPHVLVMTATPIPRTVAMTVFGDLEVSTLRELPAGRAPIQTNVVPVAAQPAWLDRAWARVREEAEKGHQVYVVCPRIGGDAGDAAEEGEVDVVDVDAEGEVLPAINPESLAAVEEVTVQLAAGPLHPLRVQMLHGRMLPDEKDAVMRSFAAGEIDVLVSTTVIEVGVDVADATMMVILDADRFGVSQLHQLRGRVGRGGLPGLCLLVTHAEPGSPALERLTAVAGTTDGFELSRVDLEARREGDVLGASQSGFRSSLVNLRVLRDEQTIVDAREAAERLLRDDPLLSKAPDLKQAVDDLQHSSEADYMEKA